MLKNKKFLLVLSKSSGRLERLLRENAFPDMSNRNVPRRKSRSSSGYKEQLRDACIKAREFKI